MNEKHHVIEYDEQCKSCAGSGLYVGFAERDGAAVVCHTCHGTGKHHVKIEYDDFQGRQLRDDVERVYETNPGICLGKGNGHKLSDFGGMPYDSWLMNLPSGVGRENRKYTCPAWWYQSANYKMKPKWEECVVNGAFSGCAHFDNKDRCWQRFDCEQA